MLPAHARRKALCLAARRHGLPARAGLAARPEPLGADATRRAWQQLISSAPDEERLDALLGAARRPPTPLRCPDWADHVCTDIRGAEPWSADHARGLVLTPSPGTSLSPDAGYNSFGGDDLPAATEDAASPPARRRRLARRPTTTDAPPADETAPAAPTSAPVGAAGPVVRQRLRRR